jgi:phosphatidylserine decarboxylase
MGPLRIEIFNRATGQVETEQFYGELWLRLLYGSGPGRLLADQVLARRWPSRLGGALQSTRSSARQIGRFVDRFQIPLDEYEPGPWRSFNEFFIRRFRPGARTFCTEPDRMPAFAEARYLAFEAVDPDADYPVKGRYLTPAALLADIEQAFRFDGGPLLLARLAPVDYHRFHFPDDGERVSDRRIPGRLHSVNPFALRRRTDILATNERRVSVLRTAHFGTLAMVEVGAMNVGRIVQTHHGREFGRGDEKGYFCFGASTILLFGEPRTWVPTDDLLEQTTQRRETLVRLGEPVARAI